LASLLEWGLWPSEGMGLPSLGQVFTHFRGTTLYTYLYTWWPIKQNHQEMITQNCLQQQIFQIDCSEAEFTSLPWKQKPQLTSSLAALG